MENSLHYKHLVLIGILSRLFKPAVMLPVNCCCVVSQEHSRKQRIFGLLYKQKWAHLQCAPCEIRPETEAFFSAGSCCRAVLWDHFKQPHHLLCFSSYLNCLLHHRWKCWSDLPAAVKASLKLAKFACYQKKQTFDDLFSEGFLSIILAAFE